jgi:uncharacterized membrane protein
MSLGRVKGYDRLILAAVLAVALAVRLAGVIAVRGVSVADVAQFEGWATDIERGQSPYVVHRCNYPPAAIFLSVFLRALARLSGITFDVLFKLPGLAADLAIVGLLYSVLQKRRSRAIASIAALGYALNPVAVIITSLHGQLDGVAALCCLVAVLLIEDRRDPALEVLSALCLGAGIGFKVWPVLLLPVVLFHLRGSPSRQARYLVLACLPAAATILPFFLDAPRAVLTSVIGYGGVTDQGWVAALRSLWFVRTGNLYLPGTLAETLTRWGKIVFVALYLVALPLGRRYWNLAGQCAMTFLLFFVFFGGLSSQYFIWLLPFSLLELEIMTVPYTLTATLALVTFYLRFFPEVLFGTRPPPALSPSTVALAHAISTGAWWLTCVAWLLALVVRWRRLPGRSRA